MLFIYLLWKSYSKYSDKKTKNTLVNAKRRLCTLEGHFVPFTRHCSCKSRVLGNGHSNGYINTFPYYRSTFKRRALLS